MTIRSLARTAIPALIGAAVMAGSVAVVPAVAKDNSGHEQRAKLRAEFAKARANNAGETTNFFARLFGLDDKPLSAASDIAKSRDGDGQTTQN